MDGLASDVPSNGPRSTDLPTPPGSRGLPLVGETLEFLRSPNEFIDARRARYGPIFFSHLLGKPTVFLFGAQANMWIYSGEGDYLQNEWPPGVRELLGDDCTSLITGARHKARRKLLAPHFRRVGMDACIPAIVSVARKHLRRWQTDAELGPIAMIPRMRRLAFEVICTYVLGDPGELDGPLEQFSRDYDTMIAGLFVPLTVAIPGTKFAAAKAARDRLVTALDDLVMRRDPERRRGPDVLSTLLDVVDERGEPLPRDTIVDELLLFLFAGHDTTVTSTSNVLYHLATYPKVAGLARAEQDQLGAPNFTLESIRAMPYLDAVIKESMRMIPPVAGSFRVMLRDASFAGFRIPKGWRISVGPRAVHFDPEIYPEPQRFWPERWLEPRERPAFSWIPFGGGPRSCIGQHFALLEMQIVLAMMLREFIWTLTPEQELRFDEIPMPRLRSGLMLDLRPRELG